MRKILINRHPESLRYFFWIHDDFRIKRLQAADKIDIRFSMPVAVPVSEAVSGEKLRVDTRFFENLPHHTSSNMLAGIKSPAGQLVMFTGMIPLLNH